jgi:thymidine kinase
MTTPHIELFIGPMFSGKTTAMFQTVSKWTMTGLYPLVISYKKDVRYGEQGNKTALARSHDGQSMQSIAVETLEAKNIPGYTNCKVIGIDEGQFFSGLAVFCDQAVKEGKIVIVAALDGDFRRDPFEEVSQLIPLCKSVKKLLAVCAICHLDAPFTRRHTTEAEREVIGGADKYIPVCQACYDRKELPHKAIEQHKQNMELVKQMRLPRV